MKKKCPICGTRFEPKTICHTFCVRRCFRIDYNRRLRKKSLGENPSFLCPNCKKLTKLNFNPKKNTVEWKSFKCPWCNYKNNIDY